MADGELWGYEQDLLAKAGLAWAEPAAHAAAALFKPNNLKSAAAVMASQHPRALDYIRQAPVLVPASRIATRQRGKAPWRDELKIWAHRVGMAPKLRDLMRQYNVALQFRALDSRILTQTRVWPANLLTHLQVNPSRLAQAIPRLRTHQAQWLSAQVEWYRRMLDRGPHGGHAGIGNQGLAHPGCYVEWAAVNLSALGSGSCVDGYRPSDLADLAIGLGNGFNTRWTLAQAAAACRDYHDRLQGLGAGMARTQDEAMMQAIRYGRGAHMVVMDEAGPVPPAIWGRNAPDRLTMLGAEFDKPVDYAPFPDEWVGKTNAAIKIVALKTARALYDEGVAMDHCVFDYWANVWAGASRIFSIRSLTTALPSPEDGIAMDGRIATFELRPHSITRSAPTVVWHWTVSQIQGPAKRRESKIPGVRAWISAYLESVLGDARAKLKGGDRP